MLMEKSFARPMRLVYCDEESGEVKVNLEAVDALKQVKGPIALLSVSGADRRGKTSVVNQVLGRSNDFQISPDHQPCSKGFWIWIVAHKNTALDDGIEYNLLLLDAEGISTYDRAETYSSQLLSLAVLLSSILTCIQMGGVNEAAFDCLSFVPKMTKHIHASISGGHDTMSELGQFSADSVWPLKVLDSLLSEFEASFHGPSKWQNLSPFVQQSLQGPILQHAKKKIKEFSSENNDLILKCRSIEDKMELITKRLESSEKLKNEYQKCYEDAIDDVKKLSDSYRSQITDLESRFRASEEWCLSLLKQLDSTAQETLQWKTKYEEMLTEEKATGNQFDAEIALLKSRFSIAEVRVAAANEQSQSSQKEADEWRNKHEAAVEETKSAQKEVDEWKSKYETAVEEAMLAQKESNEWKNKYDAAVEKAKASLKKVTMGAQNGEDSLRTLFSNSLAEKDTEIKEKVAQLEHAEQHISALSLELEAAESRIKNYESESLALNLQIKELVHKYETIRASAQTLKSQVQILEEEKNFLEQKFHSELKRSKEGHERCKVLENEVGLENELMGTGHKKDFATEIGAVGVLEPNVETVANVENTQWHIERLQRENMYLASEVDRYRVPEESAISKAALLEVKVKEREEDIKSLLKLMNENGVGTVQVVKSSSEPECEAYSVENEMKEAPSIQLYSLQGEVGLPQQKLSSNSIKETQLDSEPRSNSYEKRLRSPKVISDFVYMDTDDEKVEQSKRPKRTTTPRRCTTVDDKKVEQSKMSKRKITTRKCAIVEDKNSPIMTNKDTSGIQKSNAGDYTKFTVTELWQELMKHGFGAELLELKRPKKKDILGLYEKLVLHRH